MRTKVTEKNKDLDLRRFGKNLYTKALKEGGKSEEDTFSSELFNFINEQADNGIYPMTTLTMEQYAVVESQPNFEDSIVATYGKKENAISVIVLGKEQEGVPVYSVAFLSEEDSKAYIKNTAWNFDRMYEPRLDSFVEIVKNPDVMVFASSYLPYAEVFSYEEASVSDSSVTIFPMGVSLNEVKQRMAGNTTITTKVYSANIPRCQFVEFIKDGKSYYAPAYYQEYQ